MSASGLQSMNERAPPVLIKQDSRFSFSLDPGRGLGKFEESEQRLAVDTLAIARSFKYMNEVKIPNISAFTYRMIKVGHVNLG